MAGKFESSCKGNRGTREIKHTRNSAPHVITPRWALVDREVLPKHGLSSMIREQSLTGSCKGPHILSLFATVIHGMHNVGVMKLNLRCKADGEDGTIGFEPLSCTN